MRKFSSLIICFVAINSYSQSYQTKFIEQPIITFDCESYLVINGLIHTSGSSSGIEIKSGGLHITVSVVIDKNSPSKMMISLFAKELIDNKMVIFSSNDSQQVQYKFEGEGSGMYGGNLNDNNTYIINTRFKIIAPGH